MNTPQENGAETSVFSRGPPSTRGRGSARGMGGAEPGSSHTIKRDSSSQAKGRTSARAGHKLSRVYHALKQYVAKVCCQTTLHVWV